MPAIFALYAVFYAADRLCRKGGTFLSCVLAGVVGYWLVTAILFKWPFYWWKAVGGFASGIVFAQYESVLRRALGRKPWHVVISSLVLFAGCCFLCQMPSFGVRFVADHLYFALLGPLVVLIMYAFALPRVFNLAGVFSYELYIVHGAFVWTLLPVFKSGLLYFFAVLACSFAAGWLLHRLNRA